MEHSIKLASRLLERKGGCKFSYCPALWSTVYIAMVLLLILPPDMEKQFHDLHAEKHPVLEKKGCWHQWTCGSPYVTGKDVLTPFPSIPRIRPHRRFAKRMQSPGITPSFSSRHGSTTWRCRNGIQVTDAVGDQPRFVLHSFGLCSFSELPKNGVEQRVRILNPVVEKETDRICDR